MDLGYESFAIEYNAAAAELRKWTRIVDGEEIVRADAPKEIQMRFSFLVEIGRKRGWLQ